MENFRPLLLQEFIGQDHVKPALSLSIDVAKQTGNPFPHCLLAGCSGTGKTTLANIIANELQREFIVLYAPALKKPKTLAEILVKVGAGTIVFIDEIHRLSKLCQEALYVALEDFVIDITGKTKVFRVELEPFTLIGATTRIGLLEVPFQDRFKLVFDLQTYGAKDTVEILNFYAKKNGLAIRHEALSVLVTLSKGTARLSQRIVQNIADMKSIRNPTREVTWDDVKLFQETWRYDDEGLTTKEVDYLKVLKTHGPVSVSMLKCLMKSEIDAITQSIEPSLISLGLIAISSKGRQLTEKGESYASSL